MKHRIRAVLSKLFGVALLICTIAGTSLSARAAISPGSLSRNTAVRHSVCTSLSAQAKAYYTGNNSFENLILLNGRYAAKAALTSPATSDNSNLELWIALMCLSAAGLASLIVYGSKRKARS